ncbi:MAG TPA: hypothetical protein VHE10_00550 [Candidatus Paceibacterota bacterium]|nr:hypothetical protein [Candidatus Paceibacterota bacterium]
MSQKSGRRYASAAAQAFALHDVQAGIAERPTGADWPRRAASSLMARALANPQPTGITGSGTLREERSGTGFSGSTLGRLGPRTMVRLACGCIVMYFVKYRRSS